MGTNRKKSVTDGVDELILERPCEACAGQGIIPDYVKPERCTQCGGSGYARTELGQRVLDLMRNNFKVLIYELIGND